MGRWHHCCYGRHHHRTGSDDNATTYLWLVGNGGMGYKYIYIYILLLPFFHSLLTKVKTIIITALSTITGGPEKSSSFFRGPPSYTPCPLPVAKAVASSPLHHRDGHHHHRHHRHHHQQHHHHHGHQHRHDQHVQHGADDHHKRHDQLPFTMAI